MDKYAEVICKQNPKMTLECGNKDCRQKFDVKTMDLCKVKEYKHLCEKCGDTTTYSAEDMFADLIKQFKALGITVK